MLIFFLIISGHTPIFRAVMNDNINLTNHLVAHGADSTATAFDGDNILQWTADPQVIKQFSFLIHTKNCLGKV